MPYFYLSVSVLMSASSSVFGKFFGRKNVGVKDASILYNCLQLTSVFVFWCVLYLFDFSFDVRVLPYSLLFATCFTVCNIGIITALRNGPMTLTSLFNSLSLIVTTVWGFVFWDDEVTMKVLLGLVLVVVSIFLCLYTGKKEEKKISLKWIIFTLMAFFGNAGCSIVQRTQQIHFDGQYKYMLMTFATFLSALVCLMIYLCGDKTQSKDILKNSWYFPVTAGSCNVVLNLFVMFLATSSLSPSFIYPVIGVGGLMVVTIFSLFVFREKLKWRQWFGIFFGAAATVLLSI